MKKKNNKICKTNAITNDEMNLQSCCYNRRID